MLRPDFKDSMNQPTTFKHTLAFKLIALRSRILRIGGKGYSSLTH